MGVPHWRGIRILADHDRHLLVIGMHMPDGDWLNLSVAVEPLRPWHSPQFLAAFLLMTVTAAGLTLWAVRRLTAAGAHARGGCRGAGPRRQRAAVAGGRPIGGRDRGGGVQHDGGAHPSLRARTAPSC